MTTEVWPDGVPFEPLAGSYTRNPFLAPISTEMDGGNTRNRPRPGDDVPTVAFKIGMERSQWIALETWLRDSVALGTKRWQMPIWNGEEFEDKIVGIAPQFTFQAAEYGRGVVLPVNLRVYRDADG